MREEEQRRGEANNRESVGVRGEECEKEEEKGKRKGERNQYLRGNEKNKHKVFGLKKFLSLVLFFVILLFTVYGKNAGEDMRKQEIKRK